MPARLLGSVEVRADVALGGRRSLELRGQS